MFIHTYTHTHTHIHTHTHTRTHTHKLVARMLIILEFSHNYFNGLTKLF